MSFFSLDGTIEVEVELPQRSLLVVEGSVRHLWKHSIKRDNIKSRRISMTFRELSTYFECGYQYASIGDVLKKIASNFIC